MARIVSIEEGADGTAKAVTGDGSLFRFRACYLSEAMGPAPFDLPDEVLAAAVEAAEAEFRAVSLLARAEQFRSGLERKLAARGISRQAGRAALDRLESAGLLSDERYASSWMRARIRSHAEGPRSLSAALAAKGVDRNAVKAAVAAMLDSGDRSGIILAAAGKLAAKGAGRAESRAALVELGWRHAEVDEALDELST